jgi:hypothetical protein
MAMATPEKTDQKTAHKMPGNCSGTAVYYKKAARGLPKRDSAKNGLFVNRKQMMAVHCSVVKELKNNAFFVFFFQ